MSGRIKDTGLNGEMDRITLGRDTKWWEVEAIARASPNGVLLRTLKTWGRAASCVDAPRLFSAPELRHVAVNEGEWIAGSEASEVNWLVISGVYAGIVKSSWGNSLSIDRGRRHSRLFVQFTDARCVETDEQLKTRNSCRAKFRYQTLGTESLVVVVNRLGYRSWWNPVAKGKCASSYGNATYHRSNSHSHLFRVLSKNTEVAVQCENWNVSRII